MVYYKWCVVPKCTSTTIKTPEKLFVNVPRHAKKRKKWMLLARRNPNDISVESQVFFCEDHFEMEKDIANYYQYKMGFSKRLLVADGAVPSKFDCQASRKRCKRSRVRLHDIMARDVVRKRCAKCNITAGEDKNLIFHRFPLPGKHGMSRTRAWAIYCYPAGDWSTESSLKNLHFQHKMICSKHFDQSCYTTGSKKRLNIFAIPNDSDDTLKLHIEQNLSKTTHDTDILVEKPQLESNTNSVKRTSLEPDSPTLKQEAEMDITETSVASTSMSTIDSIMEPRRKVITVEQTSILCNFFEENPEVIRGYKRTPKCMDEVQVKWKNITPQLNAVGPPRDHRAWSKYLSDMKGKLKRKSIKWKQSCDGKEPIMCNTDDFDEIKLRMLQVLHTDVSNSQESQVSRTSDLETEAANYHNNHIEGENDEMATLSEEILDIKPKLEYLEQNNLNNVVIHYNVRTPSPELQPRELAVVDEFDYFGKNVAEQLRTLPLLVALETQEMLLSVLKKQRLKVQSSSDPLINNN